MDKWQKEALERQKREEELKEWGAQMQEAAQERARERLRAQRREESNRLMAYQLKAAEREAEKARWAERMKWVATGKHPDDFKAAWPEIRMNLAREILAKKLGVDPASLVLPGQEKPPSSPGPHEAKKARRPTVKRMRWRF